MSWTLAEFSNASALAQAIGSLRERGFRKLDAYMPHPAIEVEQALELTPSNLPKVAFCGGALGAGGAYGLQWLINVQLYPLNVGGRPAHSPLAFTPISFEMGVLLAALTGIVSIIVVSKLYRLWKPTWELERFRSATHDRYWLQIDESDSRFDASSTPGLLSELGALYVEQVTEAGET